MTMVLEPGLLGDDLSLAKNRGGPSALGRQATCTPRMAAPYPGIFSRHQPLAPSLPSGDQLVKDSGKRGISKKF